MPRRSSTRATTRTRPGAGEAGFALIEVMVSLVLLIVLATATLSLIERSGNAAAHTRFRGVAVQLAQQDQDSMRLMSIKSLSNYHVVHDPQTVGGIDYTVESQAEWMRDDATGKVVCDGSSSRVEYAKITSQVTWPNHPTPVVLESYVSPGVRGVALGSLAVKLHNDGTQGTAGIPITFQGQTVTTDSNGCATFAALNPGMSNATWSGATSLPNYVDKNGSNSVIKSVTIAASQNSYVDMMFDRASTITTNFVDNVGNAVKWNTVSASNSGMTAGVRVFGSTSAAKTTSLDSTMLFPFATAYTMYAGSCGGNAPATWDTSGSSSTAGQQIAPPGSSASVNVTLPDVGIQFKQTNTNTNTNTTTTTYPSGKTVAFEPVTGNSKMTGCTDRLGANSPDAPTTSATGVAVTQLPWGQYTACTQVATGVYARRIFNNTPSTTPAGTDAQTRDAIALPAPYAAKASQIANAFLNVTATTTNGTTTYTAGTNTTVNGTACSA